MNPPDSRVIAGALPARCTFELMKTIIILLSLIALALFGFWLDGKYIAWQAQPMTTETFVEKVKEERLKLENEIVTLSDGPMHFKPSMSFLDSELLRLTYHYNPMTFGNWMTIFPERGGEYKPGTVSVESKCEPIVTKVGDKWMIKFKP